jgi:ATP-dependent exoDNAse (exonuclease V) alpha subunit
VDTDQGETFVNRRFAYIAVSRGRYDAQLYTDDKARVADTLGREIFHRSALEQSSPLSQNPQGRSAGARAAERRAHRP